MSQFFFLFKDIVHFEKTNGRNDTSFNSYHEIIDFPVDPVEFDHQYNYIEEAGYYHSNTVIPTLQNFNEKFPKENNLELCEVS